MNYPSLQSLGEYAVALTAIFSFIGGCVVFYKKVIYRKIVAPVKSRIEKFDEISSNLKPNGGKSIYDAIHRIEKKMIVTEARSKSLIQSLNVGEFIADKDGRFVAVNNILCIQLGYTPDQFLGSNWLNLINEQDKDFVYENWQQTLKEKKDFVLGFYFVNNRGENVKVNIIATYLENNHDIVGWIGIVHFK